jgi:hypothetical protein
MKKSLTMQIVSHVAGRKELRQTDWSTPMSTDYFIFLEHPFSLMLHPISPV